MNLVLIRDSISRLKNRTVCELFNFNTWKKLLSIRYSMFDTISPPRVAYFRRTFESQPDDSYGIGPSIFQSDLYSCPCTFNMYTPRGGICLRRASISTDLAQLERFSIGGVGVFPAHKVNSSARNPGNLSRNFSERTQAPRRYKSAGGSGLCGPECGTDEKSSWNWQSTGRPPCGGSQEQSRNYRPFLFAL